MNEWISYFILIINDCVFSNLLRHRAASGSILAVLSVFLPLHFRPRWAFRIGSQAGEVMWGVVFLNLSGNVLWNEPYTLFRTLLGNSRLDFDFCAYYLDWRFQLPRIETCLGSWPAWRNSRSPGERRQFRYR